MLEAQQIAVAQGGRMLLQGVSLRVGAGQILGLSGPSGTGKTTLGRALAGLHPLARGRILLDGRARAGRWPVHYLHQSPLVAMNPRWRIGRILAEAGPMRPELLPALGLSDLPPDRFPHELSGGQLQRLSVLRGLLSRPRILIADEISAALDPLSQAQLWSLLLPLGRAEGIGFVAISHDAALLRRIADRTINAQDHIPVPCPGQFPGR